MKISTRIAGVLLLGSLFASQGNSQTLEREVIGTAGMYVESPQATMAWTLGEVCIETYGLADYYLTQGFHQPDAIIIAPEVIDFFIPEGFSPNGDGINDVFFIRGIALYPYNGITIFNRWGDEVFAAQPYLNNWDGTTSNGLQVGGDELPTGTYFYLFDFGNGAAIRKGTIYLIR